jgi:hypothetical protein
VHGEAVQPLQVGIRKAALREVVGLEVLPHRAGQCRDRRQVQPVQQLDPKVDMAVDVRPHRIAAAQPRSAPSTHPGVAVH